MSSLTFNDASKQALHIRDLYQKLNAEHGAEWSADDFMMGFVGDVGDLAKLTSAKKGIRNLGDNIDERISHELADCLWSLFVLADLYCIDLSASFSKTMEELKNTLSR